MTGSATLPYSTATINTTSQYLLEQESHASENKAMRRKNASICASQAHGEHDPDSDWLGHNTHAPCIPLPYYSQGSDDSTGRPSSPAAFDTPQEPSP
ncbi:hypothetical protein J1614_010430 [Plenodomus biglobosus]|nr:hypothetical protein J1614_010430 [Plenodomus biglobosus]